MTPINNATKKAVFICQIFVPRFWSSNLCCKVLINLIIINMLIKLTQILLKVTKLFWRRNLNGTFLMKIKDFHVCSGLQKLHKHPTRSRFINTATKCFVKPFSKSLTSISSLFFKHFKAYNDKCSFFSDVKTFWTVLNNQLVIDSINKINWRKKARSISTFDFSTVYTNRNHNKLKFVLQELINFCFKGGSGIYIAVRQCGRKWIDEKNNYNILFNKGNLKLAMTYLLCRA